LRPAEPLDLRSRVKTDNRSAAHCLNPGIFDNVIDPDQGLATDVTSGSVTFSNGSQNMSGAGVSAIFGQSLPFGLVATGPVSWSFGAQQSRPCTGSVGERICTYLGTGELSYERNDVPEPSALALVGFALAGLAVASRRRKA